MGIEAAVAGAVIGGVMQNRAASKQAAAMNQQAAAQQEAARLAAEEARFRPVGITTRFGSATPQFDQGRLSGYTYQASPEVSALQQQLSRIYGGSLEQAERAAGYQPQFEQAAQGLFGLGQQYMPQSKEQLVAEQMALLRPYDIEEEQRLAAGVFGRGRGGLSVGAGGQPELQALAEARARRNAQIAASAPEMLASRAGQAANMYTQAAGLLGSGYGTQTAALAPFQSQFQTQQGLEQAAQGPMNIGTSLGAQQSTAGAVAGQIQQSGANAAAQLQSQAAQAKAAGLAGMGAGIAGLGQQYYQQQQYGQYLDALKGTPAAPMSPTQLSQFQQGMGIGGFYNPQQPIV